MSSEESVKMVTIPESRLKELEAIEAEMSTHKTAEEYDAERFKMLRERDIADPKQKNKRSQKHYELHKVEILAKRKEQRRLAKEAKAPGVGSDARQTPSE